MNLTNSLFYSVREFLDVVAAGSVAYVDMEVSGRRFSIASSGEVLSCSIRCGWVEVTDGGTCQLTERGQRIRELSDTTSFLRQQLEDAIEALQPSWAAGIPNGRREARSSLPDGVVGIFQDAGLFDEWDDELTKYLDRLSCMIRVQNSEFLLKVGREAEKSTVLHEKSRTGRDPNWLSRETNFAGYDVLSSVDASDTTPLRIEVKGTVRRLRDATFIVTRGEWTKAARDMKPYVFHLWLMNATPPRLAVVPPSAVGPHIPNDRGKGKWDRASIPFSSFF